MSFIHSPLIALLSRALDLTAHRQTLVSQNIANVDTPGYHTRDINFGQELQRAVADSAVAGSSEPFGREVQGLIARPDGNNVSIDRESLLMAQNQLHFQTAVALLHAEFNRLQSAINGGTSQ